MEAPCSLDIIKGRPQSIFLDLYKNFVCTFIQIDRPIIPIDIPAFFLSTAQALKQ